MSNILRIKRSTSSSAPTTLQNAELAYSEASNKLYIGVGTGGAGGSATSIVAIGGTGAFLDLSTAASTYAPLASPTFTGTVTIPAGASISGYLLSSTASSTYQTISGMSSYLTTATAATTYAPLASPTFTGTVTIPAGASISGFATLANPTFTGTPAAPTATAGTNTTQIATTAFVSTAVSNLVAGAGAALDTLNELATALGNDANFATTISTSLGEKLVKANNLSDLTSAATARTNLGLGTMAVEAAADYLTKAGNLSGLASVSTARTNLGLGTIATQAASNVAITGGTIDGVTLDGGSF
jgi:hypothetical protein